MTKTLGQYFENQEIPLFIGFRGTLEIEGKKHSRIYVVDHSGPFIPRVTIRNGSINVYYRHNDMTHTGWINLWEHRNDREVDQEKFKKHIDKLKLGIHYSAMARLTVFHNRNKQKRQRTKSYAQS